MFAERFMRVQLIRENMMIGEVESFANAPQLSSQSMAINMSEVIKSLDLRADNDGDDNIPDKSITTDQKENPKEKKKEKEKEELVEDEEYLGNCHCGCCNNPKIWRRWLNVPLKLFAAVLTVFVCFKSSERYFKYWVQTSIDRTDMHVSEIAFPAVTICPLKITLIHYDPRVVKLISIAQDILWKTNDRNDINSRLRDFNSDTDSEYVNLEVKRLYGFLNHTCEELFSNCLWRRSSVPCCTLFRRQSTHLGNCFVFNSIFAVDADKTWPWSVGSSGASSGLIAHVNRKLKSMKVESIGIFLHEPNQFLGESNIYSSEDRIVVPVEPLSFTADADISARPVAIRRCFFPYEDGVTGYSRSDCVLQCHKRHLVDKCNCSIDDSLNVTTRRMCTVKDLPCFNEHQLSIFSMGNIIEDSQENVFTTIDCGCYPSCDHIQYYTASYTERLGDDRKNEIEVDVYFQDETLFSYRSVLYITFIDLIVSYGGIAGLFTGISMIGIIDAWLGRCACFKRMTKTT